MLNKEDMILVKHSLMDFRPPPVREHVAIVFKELKRINRNLTDSELTESLTYLKAAMHSDLATQQKLNCAKLIERIEFYLKIKAKPPAEESEVEDIPLPPPPPAPSLPRRGADGVSLINPLKEKPSPEAEGA